MSDRPVIQPCEVLAVEPERLLQYRFATGSLDTTITWRLAREADGTRLTLTHEGFDLDSPLGRSALEGMGQGWPGVLRRLATALGVDTAAATSHSDGHDRRDDSTADLNALRSSEPRAAR